jgi:hypothetical protein
LVNLNELSAYLSKATLSNENFPCEMYAETIISFRFSKIIERSLSDLVDGVSEGTYEAWAF